MKTIASETAAGEILDKILGTGLRGLKSDEGGQN